MNGKFNLITYNLFMHVNPVNILCDVLFLHKKEVERNMNYL